MLAIVSSDASPPASFSFCCSAAVAAADAAAATALAYSSSLIEVLDFLIVEVDAAAPETSGGGVNGDDGLNGLTAKEVSDAAWLLSAGSASADEEEKVEGESLLPTRTQGNELTPLDPSPPSPLPPPTLPLKASFSFCISVLTLSVSLAVRVAPLDISSDSSALSLAIPALFISSLTLSVSIAVNIAPLSISSESSASSVTSSPVIDNGGGGVGAVPDNPPIGEELLLSGGTRGGSE